MARTQMLYEQVIARLTQQRRLNRDDRILVLCGGSLDRDVLQRSGFSHVTISNLDTAYSGDMAPFEWSFQDAEHVSYADNTFEFAIVHMGLHHCFSPHRAMLEMLRVSRRGILCFENRDSLLLNVAKSLGLTADYELEAVTDGGYSSGGAGNGPIPNFVYRWTEREILKVVRSAFPAHPPKVEFFYGLRLPLDRLQRTSNPLLHAALRTVAPILKAIVRMVKTQGNEFGFFIEKNDELQPWLERGEGGIRVNRAYAIAHRRAIAPDPPTSAQHATTTS
jgi:hypothetical protein